MKKLTDKLKKHAIKILLPMAIVSGLAIGNSIKKYGSGCEIYQGYHRLSDDGRNEYVFDSETKTERGFRAPEYKLHGDPYLTDSLTIGKRYNFTTEKRSLPWSKKHIESILPYKSKDSQNK